MIAMFKSSHQEPAPYKYFGRLMVRHIFLQYLIHTGLPFVAR